MEPLGIHIGRLKDQSLEGSGLCALRFAVKILLWPPITVIELCTSNTSYEGRYIVLTLRSNPGTLSKYLIVLNRG